jgi:uncharacterized protein YceK
MLLRKLLLVILFFALLSGCGTVAEVVQTSPTEYSVSAEYGSLNGSWDRARAEAIAKARHFCEAKGQQVALRDKYQSGILGVTPQKSTIMFACR